MATVTAAPANAGALLRAWRQRRHLSQMDLALDAGVSTRHLSFVETGRSQPSRQMLLHLAETLDIPLRERNALLLAGGYAPVYRERELDDPEMGAVREAIDVVLRGHLPYPALVVDGEWEVIAANDAIGHLIGLADPSLLEPPVNVLRVTLHPDGLAPHIRNLAEVRAHLIGRLAREAASTGSPALASLLEEARGYDGGEAEHVGGGEILVPVRIGAGDVELSFFSTIATFGTAVDITVAELAIESFFPADEATRDYLVGNSGASL